MQTLVVFAGKVQRYRSEPKKGLFVEKSHPIVEGSILTGKFF